MVIGIRRHRRLDHRMFLQLFEHDGHRALQLRVVSRRHVFRQHLHFDIRRNAVAFDFPFTVEAEDRIARRGHIAAIEQRRVPTDADQSAPGTHPDQGPDVGLTEVPGANKPGFGASGGLRGPPTNM